MRLSLIFIALVFVTGAFAFLTGSITSHGLTPSPTATASPTPPPFTPASLSGLSLWLDASNSPSITKNGSNQVSQWNDLSGGSNNATQGTTAAKPIYSATSFNSALPGLTTSGTGQGMSFPNINISLPTIVFVAEFAGSSLGFWLSDSSNGNWIGFGPAQLNINQGANYAFKISPGLSTGVPYLLVIQPNTTTTAAASYNGIAVAPLTHSGTFSSWNFAFLFNEALLDAGFSVTLSEIEIYNRALTAPEITQLSTYEHAKWGF